MGRSPAPGLAGAGGQGSLSAPAVQRSRPFPFQHEILYEWISPVYLDMDSQAQIQEEFEERSEILLKDFLKVSRGVQPDVLCGGRLPGWRVARATQAKKGLAHRTVN